MSSVELTQSLVACRFEAFVPAMEEVDRVTLRYNYPDSPTFLRAFIALRHLLGQPSRPLDGRKARIGGAP
jgi:hypothetical protein